MKKQLAQVLGKKVFPLLVAFSIIFCSYAKSYAFTDSTIGNHKLNAVTYEGIKEKSLVFKVDYKNESSEAFQLVIKGEQNDILYSKSFEAKSLNTNILLSEMPEKSKVTFEIQTAKENLKQAFQIDSQVKTVEEYVVKGL